MEFLLCTIGGTLSGILGALGSIALAWPFFYDYWRRREGERDAETATELTETPDPAGITVGSRSVAEELASLQTALGQLAVPRSVYYVAFAGCLMLVASFGLLLGASLSTCPPSNTGSCTVTGAAEG